MQLQIDIQVSIEKLKKSDAQKSIKLAEKVRTFTRDKLIESGLKSLKENDFFYNNLNYFLKKYERTRSYN